MVMPATDTKPTPRYAKHLLGTAAELPHAYGLLSWLTMRWLLQDGRKLSVLVHRWGSGPSYPHTMLTMPRRILKNTKAIDTSAAGLLDLTAAQRQEAITYCDQIAGYHRERIKSPRVVQMIEDMFGEEPITEVFFRTEQRVARDAAIVRKRAAARKRAGIRAPGRPRAGEWD